jgi:hypothetical protein
MESGKRFGFSAVEKNKIWRRWKAGQSLHEIGRAFDKSHSSIRCCFRLAEAFLRQPVAALAVRLTWQSENCRFARLLDDWIEQPPH